MLKYGILNQRAAGVVPRGLARVAVSETQALTQALKGQALGESASKLAACSAQRRCGPGPQVLPLARAHGVGVLNMAAAREKLPDPRRLAETVGPPPHPPLTTPKTPQHHPNPTSTPHNVHQH